MPLVKIEIIKGKSNDYKEKLLSIVHMALVKALQIEDNDRFQRLYELDNADFERSNDKTVNFTMIEIIMFPGRTKERKARLYEEITNDLQATLDIKPTDVFIVIHEPPLENWGMAGKQKG